MAKHEGPQRPEKIVGSDGVARTYTVGSNKHAARVPHGVTKALAHAAVAAVERPHLPSDHPLVEIDRLRSTASKGGRIRGGAADGAVVTVHPDDDGDTVAVTHSGPDFDVAAVARRLPDGSCAVRGYAQFTVSSGHSDPQLDDTDEIDLDHEWIIPDPSPDPAALARQVLAGVAGDQDEPTARTSQSAALPDYPGDLPSAREGGYEPPRPAQPAYDPANDPF